MLVGGVTAKDGNDHICQIGAKDLDGRRNFSCSVIVTKPEEVTQLRKYFSNHLELSLISESDLSAALYEFFNSNNTTESNSGSESSIVDNLDKFLNLKFNLENLKKTYQERLQPVVEIKLSSQAGI